MTKTGMHARSSRGISAATISAPPAMPIPGANSCSLASRFDNGPTDRIPANRPKPTTAIEHAEADVAGVDDHGEQLADGDHGPGGQERHHHARHQAAHQRVAGDELQALLELLPRPGPVGAAGQGAALALASSRSPLIRVTNTAETKKLSALTQIGTAAGRSAMNCHRSPSARQRRTGEQGEQRPAHRQRPVRRDEVELVGLHQLVLVHQPRDQRVLGRQEQRGHHLDGQRRQEQRVDVRRERHQRHDDAAADVGADQQPAPVPPVDVHAGDRARAASSAGCGRS